MLLEEVAAFLEAQGLGTQGTNLFAGGPQVDSPNDGIFLIHAPGLPGIYTMGPSGSAPAIERPRLQVWTTWSDQENGRAKAEAVHAALRNVYEQTLSGVRYLSIDADGEVADLGKDANGRWQFSANYSVRKKPS